jgi:putative hydrolase of the HAD superfamily
VSAHRGEGGLARLETEGLLVCLDFDDTLVANQAHFAAATSALAELCARDLGADAAAVASAFGAADRGLGAHGRHRNRFLLSVLATYCRVAGTDSVPLDRMAELARIAAMPYDAVPTPEPGVPQALAVLRGNLPGPLWLVTAGDPVVQEGRVRRSGLADRFDAVHIVPEKTASVYAALGRGYTRAWMVGNSPATDILPARAAGFQVVLVTVPTWDLDVAPVPPDVPQPPELPAAVRYLLEQLGA